MSIYLDYNATCPIRTSAKDAWVEACDQLGNSSSAHTYGRQARSYVDHARRVIQEQLKAPGTRVIFTSGGTESNNLALRGLTEDVIISSVEHSAVKNAQSDATVIPVTTVGLVDLSAAEALFKEASNGAVVSVMLVNNETGVIQPVKEIVKLAKAHGLKVHTDAVQAIGKIDVSFKDLGVDTMTISSHKFGGPLGCGALIVKEELQLQPIMRGGGHEFGMRSGTVPMPLIHAMGVALIEAVGHIKDYQRLDALRERIEDELSPEVVVHGKGVPRVANTLCISMPGAESQLQLMAFDLAGIAVSVGSACSSGRVATSPVLKAMHVDEAIARQAIRVSLGYLTTEDEVSQFINEWKKIYKTAHNGTKEI